MKILWCFLGFVGFKCVLAAFYSGVIVLKVPGSYLLQQINYQWRAQELNWIQSLPFPVLNSFMTRWNDHIIKSTSKVASILFKIFTQILVDLISPWIKIFRYSCFIGEKLGWPNLFYSFSGKASHLNDFAVYVK